MIKDEVHAFHRHAILLMPLVRSGQLSQFELNYLAGTVETLRAELEAVGAQTSEQPVRYTKADHQLEAHLDGLSCSYDDCVQCYPLGRRVALIGHPGAGCTALTDATGERCREACCSQLEPPFEGELPL